MLLRVSANIYAESGVCELSIIISEDVFRLIISILPLSGIFFTASTASFHVISRTVFTVRTARAVL